MTKEERNLALKALEQIAKHERECGERYGDVVTQLSELRKQTDAHADRGEKIAWLLGSAVVTTGVSTWLLMLGG